MEKQKRESLRELGYYSGLGLSMGLSIFIGLFTGIFLDKKFGTHPLLMLVFLAIGVAAGFSNIIRAINRVNRKNEAPKERVNGNNKL